MIPDTDYYGAFDYAKAYGSNPFTEPSKYIAQLLERQDEAVNRSAAGRSGSAASWSTGPARPDDPEVEDYMSYILGGQRKTLDDYVSRAAGAGIKRGGLNVVGGPALESALHQAAMKTLASGFADRFSEAMNYNKYQKEAGYSQYEDAIRDLQNVLGLQHRFLTSQTDWQNRLGDTMHGDWRGDVDWNRSAPNRELELEQTRRRMEQERLRNVWEQEDRQRATADKSEQELKWRALAAKLGATTLHGAIPVGWTGQDNLWLDRLGVQMGYLKPRDRKLEFKGGGGGGGGNRGSRTGGQGGDPSESY